MNNKQNIIMASVYLKSQSGKSLLNTTVPTSNLEDYKPSEEAVNKAIKILEKKGFKIEAIGITISISAPQEIFEKTFNVQFSYERS